MHRDIHRLGKAFARTVGDPTVQIVLRAPDDGMQNEIEPTPFALDTGEQAVEGAVLSHVERLEDRSLNPCATGLTWGFAFSFR